MARKTSQLTQILRHFKKTLESKPELGIVFRPPTTLKKIRDFENDYDWEIPSEVVELLLVFDGEDTKQSQGSCLRFKFCSLATALKTFGMARDVSNNTPRRIPECFAPHVSQELSWNDLWHPLAENDFGCDAIYYDEYPSESGKDGQIFSREDDHCIGAVKAIGLEDLLTTLLDVYESNIDLDHLPYFFELPNVIKTKFD